MSQPRKAVVPLTAATLAYVQRHNAPDEPYGRTIARILTAAAALDLEPAEPTPIKLDRPWSEADTALVLDGHTTTTGGQSRYTYTADELSERLDRTPQAIHAHRRRLTKEHPE